MFGAHVYNVMIHFAVQTVNPFTSSASAKDPVSKQFLKKTSVKSEREGSASTFVFLCVKWFFILRQHGEKYLFSPFWIDKFFEHFFFNLLSQFTDDFIIVLYKSIIEQVLSIASGLGRHRK